VTTGTAITVTAVITIIAAGTKSTRKHGIRQISGPQRPSGESRVAFVLCGVVLLPIRPPNRGFS